MRGMIWTEWLRALGAIGVMIAGGLLPTLAGAALKRSHGAVTALGAAGFGAGAIAVAIWIGVRLGWHVYASSTLLWGLSGFAFLGFLLAVLMGTFATDAPRPAAAKRRAFTLVFTVAFLGSLAIGLPFAAFVSWPRTPWLRPLLAPASLLVLMTLLTPLGRLAGAITFGRRPSAPTGSMSGLGESPAEPSQEQA
jgi:hypothetical protein